MTAGIGGSGPINKVFVITDLDRKQDIVGQFIPQSVTKNVSANIGNVSSLNRQYPILQWLSGELETFTFTAKLFNISSEDFTAQEKLIRLEDLVKRNDDLERPPICAFSWGYDTTLTIDCLVKSLGGITYDEIRNDGSVRGVTLQITLLRYEEVEIDATDPSVPEKFTRIRRAKKGDTYESIALDEYGDPELGILLRQLNPRIPGMELADLNPKDQIHIFPEEYLVTLEIQPEFHAFKSGSGNELAEARRRDIFEERNGDKYVTYFADNSIEEF